MISFSRILQCVNIRHTKRDGYIYCKLMFKQWIIQVKVTVYLSLFNNCYYCICSRTSSFLKSSTRGDKSIIKIDCTVSYT